MSTFEVKNFEIDVLEASEAQPVLVDFWAPWCGPCRVLGPIIEKLANEERAAWKLVKVDTDQHPELSERFHIRGIPNVKMFYHGAVIAELAGALPEHELRRWIADQLPGEDKEALMQGIEYLQKGLEQDAIPLLQKAADAGLADAKVWLAQAIVLEEPQKAIALLEHAGLSDKENALREIAVALLDRPLSYPADPAREPYAAGVEALRASDFSAALDNLIQSVSLNKEYQNEMARKLVVAIFQLLGPTHPSTVEHRRAFSMALY